MSGEKVNEKVDASVEGVGQHHDILRDEVLANQDLINDAIEAENAEHAMDMWTAAKKHPAACLWAFLMCFTIIMESFDMFLNSNWGALPYFKYKYGVYTGPVGGDLTDANNYTIPTKWQASLFQSGQCGAFVGVFLAGPITTRLGYRWTTIVGLVLMNATIFITFFADSLAVLVISQAFEGIPWGLFIANSPAYASEVVPIVLRGAVTGTLQMSWSIGGIIVAAASYGYNKRMDQWSWRVPAALQWIFPTPIILLLLFAPESPWWLVRHGRREQALKSCKRLGPTDGTDEQAARTLAMIERTVEIEQKIGGNPTLLDLFKGTDLRRTLIICLMYASQNLAGNLIANQATYFFEQAGMSSNFSFQLSLINSCLGFIANAGSWILTKYFTRRQIYIYGTAFNVTMLILLGICASVKQNQHTSYAQACLGVIISFVFAGAMGPISYTIIAETSSIRLRPLSTAVGRASYYVFEIPLYYLNTQLLNTTGWDVAGKCGYVWGGTAFVCMVAAYFWLPELKGRSYREIDILFQRRVPARDFEKTVIDATEND
ncbi:hypothetical protein BP6252_09569 [Coleophoma cylindrospora]|uniref:Major facilitator superfamily (MFS) profile domain-containing protein n=1 Tax=Coleophoma cylindrospora TaxID=1849047 RepID=A0A3D8R2A5_9HELO|nr:hypothetical protein BP6252_09569 [Coleophoma cylindrospora]